MADSPTQYSRLETLSSTDSWSTVPNRGAESPGDNRSATALGRRGRWRVGPCETVRNGNRPIAVPATQCRSAFSARDEGYGRPTHIAFAATPAPACRPGRFSKTNLPTIESRGAHLVGTSVRPSGSPDPKLRTKPGTRGCDRVRNAVRSDLPGSSERPLTQGQDRVAGWFTHRSEGSVRRGDGTDTTGQYPVASHADLSRSRGRVL